ncbi:PhzF family phenazine biosynthesis protein [Hoeflea sp.]|uniref:PhzF family phenazine biosynthesis protein n=1 Tax=Hoeflea sp. TaxID=1940281 RepID=UPI003748D360
MNCPFRTVDVFTTRRFGGNPLAVVLNADALDSAQMQAIAREFSYSETTFIMRPTDPANTARVRIFTPVAEVPFAGHPNVGTAYVLATLEPSGSRATEFVFEEQAGLVPVSLRWSGDTVENVEVAVPEVLSQGSRLEAGDVAASLSLETRNILTTVHPPGIASVGLPFLVVEVATRKALAAARVNMEAVSRILPTEAADAIYLYCRHPGPEDGSVDLTARMFAPWDGVPEDPATGSATAAACALISSLQEDGSRDRHFKVAQGIDMNRPSLIEIRVDAGGRGVRISGTCVPVLSGEIQV